MSLGRKPREDGRKATTREPGDLPWRDDRPRAGCPGVSRQAGADAARSLQASARTMPPAIGVCQCFPGKFLSPLWACRASAAAAASSNSRLKPTGPAGRAPKPARHVKEAASRELEGARRRGIARIPSNDFSLYNKCSTPPDGGGDPPAYGWTGARSRSDTYFRHGARQPGQAAAAAAILPRHGVACAGNDK